MDIMYRGSKVSGNVPLATAETPGIVQIGKGISVYNGVISAGESKPVSAGSGIKITDGETTVVVALTDEVLAQLADAITSAAADEKYLPVNNPVASNSLTVERTDAPAAFNMASKGINVYLSLSSYNHGSLSGFGAIVTDTPNTGEYGAIILNGIDTPENPTDAVNKKYVDNVVGSIQSALDKILN